jgi:formylglycine-generating enzyme required for sulfatase activity
LTTILDKKIPHTPNIKNNLYLPQTLHQIPMSAPLKTFIIYSRHDAQFKDELRTHLNALERKGYIHVFVDTDLLPGEEWSKRLENELKAAHLVLILVSADALNSDFIQERELKTAIEKRNSGSARVIPIIVRDCMWQLEEELAALQMLPKNKEGRIEPIGNWPSRDNAWAETVRELLKTVQEMKAALDKENEATERANKAKAAEAAKQAADAQAEKLRNKKDEQAWETLQSEIAKAATFDEKIGFVELYINDSDYHNHQEAAEDLLHDLLAQRETHEKIEAQKKKAEEERKAKAAVEKLRQSDEAAWRIAEEANTIAAYEAYLAKKENTLHQKDAEERIKDLKVTQYKNGDLHRDLLYTPEMIYVEGGTFQMGSNEAEWAKPIHPVTLSPFWIGKYPITGEEYEVYFKETKVTKPIGSGGRYPVVFVNWDDATRYAQWLSKKTGKKYRLPTEAEWEYAAKGGNVSKGYTYAGSNDMEEVAWYNENSGDKTHPVGEKKANELGLHDMSGNVWEWCADWWPGSYTSEAQTNPSGPDWGVHRVLRGGSYFGNPQHCRAASRGNSGPYSRNNYFGFRLVLQSV